MSSTTTITTRKLNATLKPFVDSLVSAATVVAKAEDAVQNARVTLGRIVAQAVSALTTAGASSDEAQDAIMSKIGFAHLEWATVQAWVRAATVEDSLAESLHGTFGVDSLVALGRLTHDPDGDSPRLTLAEELAESGTTTIRPVREAVAAAKGSGNGAGTAKGTRQASSAIVKKVTKIADEVRAMLESSGIEWTDDRQAAIYAVADLGIRIGRGGKASTKPLTNAAEEVLYFGPVNEDGGEDENDK
jgi:hypothetical protein